MNHLPVIPKRCWIALPRPPAVYRLANYKTILTVDCLARVDDDAALEIALGLFGDAGLGELKTLPKEKCDASLARMKEDGLTVRQIQRLTGVSLGVISKA